VNTRLPAVGFSSSIPAAICAAVHVAFAPSDRVEYCGVSYGIPAAVTVPADPTVICPLPNIGGANHPPSPRQNVWLVALTPPPRFAIGRLPVMSAVRSTGLQVGRPLALPCSRLVAVPSDPSTSKSPP